MDGVDIVINIIDKDCNIIEKDIFDGRYNIWFDNLAGHGTNEVYNKLKIHYGKLKGLEYPDEEFYFNFRYFRVRNFRDWYIKYRPNISVGWVNTYTKWLIENREYYPDNIKLELPIDVNPADWHFIEYKDKEDCSDWLYTYLHNNNIDEEAYVVYYFYK